jgi:hypothetical protein
MACLFFTARHVHTAAKRPVYYARCPTHGSVKKHYKMPEAPEVRNARRRDRNHPSPAQLFDLNMPVMTGAKNARE